MSSIFIKNLQKIISIIFLTRFKFFKPNKNKYLIFDNTNSDIIKNYLKKNFTVLHTRYEQLNLFILVANFFKKKFTLIDYYESYMQYVNPKFIITCIDNNPIFYLLKKKSYQKKILFQMGWKNPVDDSSLFFQKRKNIFAKKNKEYNVDIAFVYNKYIGKFFKRLNCKKIIILGSIKSNFFNISKKKKIEMLYISSFSIFNPDLKYHGNVSYKKYFLKKIRFFNSLKKYLKKYDIELYILGKNKKYSLLEYNYYQNIFGDLKWNFLAAGKHNSYKIVDNSKIVLTMRSTLGYESLSRGNKTIFINPHSNIIKNINFGWPNKKLKKNGFFWTTKTSFNDLEKIINHLRDMKEKKFLSISKNFSNNLLPHSKNNYKLKTII